MDFVIKYFINPIVYGQGYNSVNTIVFALIFLLSLWVVKKLLDYFRISLSEDLFLKLVPFVLLGGELRALQDINFFNFLGWFRFLFVTPGIYFSIFFVAFLVLIVEKRTRKKVVLWTGVVLDLIFFSFILFYAKNWVGFLIAIELTVLSFLVVFILFKKFMDKRMIYLPVFAHALDACSSVTAILIVGGFKEQHVVPNLLLRGSLFWFFIPIKILLALAVVYLIDIEEKDENWKWLFLFSILALGLGPGTRDALTILIH
jgi:uncharacterized membrane protein